MNCPYNSPMVIDFGFITSISTCVNGKGRGAAYLKYSWFERYEARVSELETLGMLKSMEDVFWSLAHSESSGAVTLSKKIDTPGTISFVFFCPDFARSPPLRYPPHPCNVALVGASRHLRILEQARPRWLCFVWSLQGCLWQSAKSIATHVASAEDYRIPPRRT